MRREQAGGVGGWERRRTEKVGRKEGGREGGRRRRTFDRRGVANVSKLEKHFHFTGEIFRGCRDGNTWIIGVGSYGGEISAEARISHHLNEGEKEWVKEGPSKRILRVKKWKR